MPSLGSKSYSHWRTNRLLKLFYIILQWKVGDQDDFVVNVSLFMLQILVYLFYLLIKLNGLPFFRAIYKLELKRCCRSTDQVDRFQLVIFIGRKSSKFTECENPFHCYFNMPLKNFCFRLNNNIFRKIWN